MTVRYEYNIIWWYLLNKIISWKMYSNWIHWECERDVIKLHWKFISQSGDMLLTHMTTIHVHIHFNIIVFLNIFWIISIGISHTFKWVERTLSHFSNWMQQNITNFTTKYLHYFVFKPPFKLLFSILLHSRCYEIVMWVIFHSIIPFIAPDLIKLIEKKF